MNENDLNNLMQCLTIVSYVDGFDSQEFEVINEVFQGVWEKSSKELDDLVEQMVKDVSGFNANGTIQTKFEECIGELASSLDEQNKGKIKEIMIKLIKADGKITGEETEYYLKLHEAFS